MAHLSGAELAALVEANHRESVEHERQRWQLAAAWADLHDLDLAEWSCRLVERARVVGGAGTRVLHFRLSDTTIRTGRGMVRPDNGDDPTASASSATG